jgi:hypothetical protein
MTKCMGLSLAASVVPKKQIQELNERSRTRLTHLAVIWAVKDDKFVMVGVGIA